MVPRRYMNPNHEAWPYEYKAWCNIKQRCLNPQNPRYESYGLRGIAIYEPWRVDFHRFRADLHAEIGERPSLEHSLDRRDNDGNYEPGNLRWATQKEQSRNTRQNVRLEYAGESLLMCEWAERTGLPFYMIQQRISHGWTTGEALGFEDRPTLTRDTPAHSGPVTTLEDRHGAKVEEAAARLGMTRQAIYERIEYGWTVEDALTIPKGQRRPRIGRGGEPIATNEPIVFNGETLSVAGWAMRLGIPMQTLRNRLQAGWDLEAALTTPGRPYKRKERAA